jgi:hypothetical protein
MRRLTAKTAQICSNCLQRIPPGATVWTRGPVRICAACERKT